MSTQKIQEGINYLRMMNNGMRMDDIVDDLNVTEARVKDCIRAAREHRDAASKPPKVVLKEPNVKVFKDLMTGEMQAVESVEVELLRDIIVKFAREDVSEFQTMLPVTVRIKRKTL